MKVLLARPLKIVLMHRKCVDFKCQFKLPKSKSMYSDLSPAVKGSIDENFV